jgi:cold shock protein
VRILDPIPSLQQSTRRPAEELHGVVDDMIKMLEAKVQPDLRRGRYPDKRTVHRIAEVVRAVANELEL